MVNQDIQFGGCLFSQIEVLFFRLKLEIALAIPASNESKIPADNYSA